MKKLKLLIVLTLVIAIGLTMGVSFSAFAVTSAKDTINVAWPADTGSLAPLSNSASEYNVVMYDSLYKIDMSKKTLAFTPCIASSWEYKDTTHMILQSS